MGKFIPNENSYIGFSLTCANIHAPTVAEVNAAVDLTAFVTGVNAASTGNTVPTPSFDTLFETSIPGTTSAAFSMDMYRDDEDDLGWDTLPRGTSGFVFISRYGGKPAATEPVEVWPVRISSRANGQMANNSVQTFTVTAAVPVEPDEDAVVAA